MLFYSDAHWSIKRIVNQISPSYRDTDFDLRHFWKWTDFRSYVEFIAAFTASASLLTYLLIGHVVYVEALGFTSLLIEAMLGMPQFYDNYVSKSTFGMRYLGYLNLKRARLWPLAKALISI